MANAVPKRILNPPAARCKDGKDAPRSAGARSPNRTSSSHSRGRPVAGKVTVETIIHGITRLHPNWIRAERVSQDRKYAAKFLLTLIGSYPQRSKNGN
jgi:hypothetical protein